MKIIVKKLESCDLIEDACALLYEEYIEKYNWVFSDNNPSKIKIVSKSSRKLLVDRVVEHAVWFGAFHGKKIIGCIRIFKANEKTPFEIEQYASAQEIVSKYIMPNKPNLYECTRACVSSEYKGKKILNLLYLHALQYCQRERASIFGSTNNAHVKFVLKQIGWPLKLENAFKFEESELMPVNFYLASYSNREVISMVRKLELIKNSDANRSISILEALEIVAPVLPAPIYWHDKAGVVLGINDLCLEGMGTTRDKVVGKTPYDFYPKKLAEYILKHNAEIMETGKVSFQEESINDVTTGEYKAYLAVKAPLYDDDKNIIGIVGTSINITAEKEAEHLKAEIEKHRAVKAEQDKFQVMIEQLMHVLNGFKASTLNDQLGVIKSNSPVIDLKLTRREQEVLYFLSLNKSPKEIAQIISILYNKEVNSKTIQSVIDRQLYSKFGVYSISHLIEEANSRQLIPFLLDKSEYQKP